MSHRKYKIKLTPEDGPTLIKRTKEEWSLGYIFKVVWCDGPLFRHNQRITIEDIQDQEDHHGCRYTVSFDTLDTIQKLEAEAKGDNDYFASLILDTMVEEDQDGERHILLTAGQ